MSRAPHHCGRCDARWWGAGVCHCAADGCHQTFAGIGIFDTHRVKGACVDPHGAPDVFAQLKPGVWSRTSTIVAPEGAGEGGDGEVST